MENGPTKFERILRSLEPLTSREVVDVVRVATSKKDAEELAAAADRLSPDSVRILAARVLLRSGA